MVYHPPVDIARLTTRNTAASKAAWSIPDVTEFGPTWIVVLCVLYVVPAALYALPTAAGW